MNAMGREMYYPGHACNPRNNNKEETLTMDTDDLLLIKGTPVICHGLKHASY
jgi:hypothetical protein